MSGIPPTKMHVFELRNFVRHVYAAPPAQPVGEVIRKFQADYAAAAEAQVTDPTAPPLLAPTARVKRPRSSAAALGRPDTEYTQCSVCNNVYKTLQPGQHFATHKHCKALRAADIHWCSLRCAFRTPAARVTTPPPPGVNVLAPTAPSHLDVSSGVTVCRGCGGMRARTELLPPTKTAERRAMAGVKKRGRPPKKRPEDAAAAPPPVQEPAAAAAVPAAAAPLESAVVASVPAPVSAPAQPPLQPLAPSQTKTIQVRGRTVTVGADWMAPRASDTATTASTTQSSTTASTADTRAPQSRTTVSRKRARVAVATPVQADDNDDGDADDESSVCLSDGEETDEEDDESLTEDAEEGEVHDADDDDDNENYE